MQINHHHVFVYGLRCTATGSRKIHETPNWLNLFIFRLYDELLHRAEIFWFPPINLNKVNNKQKQFVSHRNTLHEYRSMLWQYRTRILSCSMDGRIFECVCVWKQAVLHVIFVSRSYLICIAFKVILSWASKSLAVQLFILLNVFFLLVLNADFHPSFRLCYTTSAPVSARRESIKRTYLQR